LITIVFNFYKCLYYFLNSESYAFFNFCSFFFSSNSAFFASNFTLNILSISSFLISEACINVSEIMNFYPNSSLSLVLIKSILASTLFLDKLLSLNSFRILFIISFLVSYEPCIRKISAFNNS